jgi:hypothetical protein
VSDAPIRVLIADDQALMPPVPDDPGRAGRHRGRRRAIGADAIRRFEALSPDVSS